MSEFAGAYLFIVIFLIVLAILWILMPFAIFGTKPKLDGLREELRDIKAQLVVMTAVLRELKASDAQGNTTPVSSAETSEPR